MLNNMKYLNLLICLLVLCDVTTTPGFGQQNRNRKPNKAKTGGKFIPGKTRLGSNPYYPPRARRPTLGDVLKRQNQATQPKRRRPPANRNVDHSDPESVNRMNYLNNLKNNNNVHANNFRPNSHVQPNVGKITPPLIRSEGEKPPFAPSWTHCVITIQVSIAWVVVKSPHYPNKFQGQVQCSWIATAMDGYRVRLSFKDLDLLTPNGNGCGSQFVEVIDMELEKSQARFCGNQIPGDYVSQGNKLRLDLQADAIATPYRGFMAAFKADREVPGRRETSYFAHGTPNMLYNPLTESPPSNPLSYPRGPAARRPVVRTTTRPRAPLIPGQKIYGSRNQPRDEVKNKEPEETSSTTHLYIIIAVILVILLAAAAGYVFKRCFYKQFKAWRKRQKNGKDWKETESNEMETINDIYSKQKPLPGTMPLPPTPDMSGDRRQSVGFAGNGYYGVNPNMMEQDAAMFGHPSMTSLNNGQFHGQFGLHRSASMGDISNHGWQQDNGEPIYEDDTMSMRSLGSVRSSNRHPEHESYKRQKIMERQNSLRMRRNSFSGQYPPQSDDMYNVLNPYQTQSLYGQQEQQPGYGYGQTGDVYGSLPPTMGPGSNGMYGMYPQHYPKAQEPLFTSSTSNLVQPTGNMGVQRFNRRSASMYDVTDIDAKPEVKSQWSDQLDQRLTSVASSNNSATSSATNPILKKTKSTQNELAFTALRAAKSMTDLTAINTKLNECVSWTLPSQRRKSVVG